MLFLKVFTDSQKIKSKSLSLTLNNKTFHFQSECMSLISVCEEDWPDKVE